MAVAKEVMHLSVRSLNGDSPPCSTSSNGLVNCAIKKKAATSSGAFLPPCRVCNAIASGFHYGANTCEACKAFFRRSIGHEVSIKPCRYSRKCADNPTGKISCSACRHKKCMTVGMAKNGCRKGRYTYEKKTQDTKEVRLKQADDMIARSFVSQQCAETVARLVCSFERIFPELVIFMNRKTQIDKSIEQLMYSSGQGGKCLSQVLYLPGYTSQFEEARLCDTVNSLIKKAAYSCNSDEREKALSMGQEMVYEAWAIQYDKICYAITVFAKSMPGFNNLQLDDRIILIKQGKADTLNIIRHKVTYLDIEATVHYSPKSGDLLLLPLLFLRRVLQDQYADGFVKVTERIQRLQFTVEDMAVLLTFVTFVPDREGLQRKDLVEKLQDFMLPVLQYTLKKNHPSQPNILADTLLLLPMIRENSVVNDKYLQYAHLNVHPETAPVLAEYIKPF